MAYADERWELISLPGINMVAADCNAHDIAAWDISACDQSGVQALAQICMGKLFVAYTESSYPGFLNKLPDFVTITNHGLDLSTFTPKNRDDRMVATTRMDFDPQRKATLAICPENAAGVRVTHDSCTTWATIGAAEIPAPRAFCYRPGCFSASSKTANSAQRACKIFVGPPGTPGVVRTDFNADIKYWTVTPPSGAFTGSDLVTLLLTDATFASMFDAVGTSGAHPTGVGLTTENAFSFTSKVMCWDRSSGVDGATGRMNRYFVHTPGTAKLFSVNNVTGAVTVINNAPIAVQNIDVHAATGVVMMTSFSTTAVPSEVHRYAPAGSITKSTAPGGLVGIACHHSDGNKVFAAHGAGRRCGSADGGLTFSDLSADYGGGKSVNLIEDADWVTNSYTSVQYMANGCLVWMPYYNRLCLPDGVSVYFSQTNPPADATAATWYGFAKGIKNMVGAGIALSPDELEVLGACHDRPLWSFVQLADGTFAVPTQVYPDTQFSHANNADFAIDNPQYSAFVRSGGEVWSRSARTVAYSLAATQPTVGFTAGVLAISNAGTEVVSGQSVDGSWRPQFRFNFGAWAKVDFGSAPINAEFDNAHLYNVYSFNRKHLVADKNNPGDFYIQVWAQDPSASLIAGYWRIRINMTTGVQTATRLRAGNLSDLLTPPNGLNFDYYNCQLEVVTGFPNVHLYVTGPGDNEAADEAERRFLCSLNGGSAWFALTNLPAEPVTFCLGKPAPGKTFPTIYFFCENAGFYKCEDFNPTSQATAQAATSVAISKFIGGFPGGPVKMVGSRLRAGRFFCGTGPMGPQGYQQQCKLKLAS
ncbi:MAG: hypothetical protein V4530_05985 [Pseudomonadota bacterium]